MGKTTQTGSETNEAEARQRLNVFLNRYFRLLSAAISAGLLAIGAVTVILPRYSRIQAGVKAGREYQQEVLDRKTVYYSKLSGFISSYNRVSSADLEKISRILPENNDIESLVEEVELLVQNSGYSLDSIKVSVPPPPPPPVDEEGSPLHQADQEKGVKRIAIEVRISEVYGYDGFKDLLRAFERNLRIMDVQEIDYNEDQDSYALKIDTYYY